MKKKVIFTLIILTSLLCTFFAGYTLGVKVTDVKTTDYGFETQYSRWIKAKEPPLPEVTIAGTKIKVVRSSYTWCYHVTGSTASCVSADAAAPSQLTPTLVPAGAKIDTKAPEGIKEFTISMTNKSYDGDPYFVPEQKGIYDYRIHCEWFLDQGQVDFYFSIEVE